MLDLLGLQVVGCRPDKQSKATQSKTKQIRTASSPNKTETYVESHRLDFLEVASRNRKKFLSVVIEVYCRKPGVQLGGGCGDLEILVVRGGSGCGGGMVLWERINSVAAFACKVLAVL